MNTDTMHQFWCIVQHKYTPSRIIDSVTEQEALELKLKKLEKVVKTKKHEKMKTIMEEFKREFGIDMEVIF